TENAALNADIFGYNMADKDFAARFPGLVQARNDVLNQSQSQLEGPLNPTVQNEFLTREQENAGAAFGAGSEVPTTGAGTIGGNAVKAGFTRDLLGYQDAARSTINSLIENPEFLPRAFGNSGSQAVNQAIENLALYNQANQNAKQAKFAQQNADIAASNAG